MMAEGRGEPEVARGLFAQAWEKAADDFEASIAAHYVARHQDTPEEALAWNLRALGHAQAVDDERVTGFLASLHLNLGRSYEDLDDRGRAAEQYALAEASLAAVPDDGYGAPVRRGVAAARVRVPVGGECK